VSLPVEGATDLVLNHFLSALSQFVDRAQHVETVDGRRSVELLHEPIESDERAGAADAGTAMNEHRPAPVGLVSNAQQTNELQQLNGAVRHRVIVPSLERVVFQCARVLVLSQGKPKKNGDASSFDACRPTRVSSMSRTSYSDRRTHAVTDTPMLP
jgi:hypothetical protein